METRKVIFTYTTHQNERYYFSTRVIKSIKHTRDYKQLRYLLETEQIKCMNAYSIYITDSSIEYIKKHLWFMFGGGPFDRFTNYIK